jgi:hypothetical protein
MMASISHFQTIDDDEQSFVDAEFEAGYDARMRGDCFYWTATRSWRAGWADADMTCIHTTQGTAA